MTHRHSRHYLGAGFLIGVLAGIAATGFHFLADSLGHLMFSWIRSNSIQIRLPLVVLVPTLLSDQLETPRPIDF